MKPLWLLALIVPQACACPLMQLFVEGRVPEASLAKARRQGCIVEVYDMNEAKRMKQEIHGLLNAGGLPPDRNRARAIVEKRLKALDQEPWRSRLAKAMAGPSLAGRYRLKRLPAAVVDGRMVLYGESDPVKVLAQWRRDFGEAAP